MIVRDARANVMRAIPVVEKLLVHSDSGSKRLKYTDLLMALHRELAKLDTIVLSESNAEYAALTIRFASARAELIEVAKDAKKAAKALQLTAAMISSLTKLAAVL